MAYEDEIEHGVLYVGGAVLVWDTSPEIEEVYPLEARIKNAKRQGCKVLKRRIIVLEDWEVVDGV